MIAANNPSLTSWLDVSPGSDFPIQNLPFGIFKKGDDDPRVGVAMGGYVLDLACLHEYGFFDSLNLPQSIFKQKVLNDFFALGKVTVRNVRERISQLLQHDNIELKDNETIRENAIISLSDVTLLMPVHVHNYTDFYSSREHATNVGSMFRDPQNALLPNWKHLPVAYHGRASSIVVSGTPLHRPKGQLKLPTVDHPIFGPSSKLDFELEMAFITCKETALGESLTTQQAEDAIIGFVLFNDWSARDIQQWEYAPLGPFLGKNFGSTISPWVVLMDALEPFRVDGPNQDPPVLPYLEYKGAKNFDIDLEVAITTSDGASAVVSNSNFQFMYWNVNQQLAHHTVNGCNLQVGDLYASGTISGKDSNAFGSLLEITWNGTKPLALGDGITRTFLEDGDTVVMKGYAEKAGVRIGFGECKGKILPAI